MKMIIACLLSVIALTRATKIMTSYVSSTYDWDSRSSSITATCINIPRNLTLCHNIGYDHMRLPNLLEHDTLSEVSQQAASWVPLLNVRCHPDTQRFLCSLFSPVCLDHPIYPCRSLCEKVRSGCETRMKMYGFPWPAMFSCTLFPVDNDMCITSESASQSAEERCRICEQINTVENILDHYCQSHFAIRGKLKKSHTHQLTFKKLKLFKADMDSITQLKNEMFTLNGTEECCREKIRENHSSYFIMGTYKDNRLNPTFIMPWEVKRSKSFKKSIRMLKTINCTNPDDITQTVIRSTLPSPKSTISPNLAKSKNKSNTTEARRKSRKRNKNSKIKNLYRNDSMTRTL